MIEIVKPGPLASVQDLGRHGHRQLGICPGGALDTLSLTVANRLVGNPDGAAGLELTLGNAEIRFHTPTRIALTGEAFGARLGTRDVRAGWSVPVEAGDVLRLQGQASGDRPGLRTWLAVAGGIDVEPMLGSRSTDLKAGFGGLEGRALRKGDRLPVGESRLTDAQRARRAFGVRLPEDAPAEDDATVLRVMAGPESAQFTLASLKDLHAAPWRITPQSNRMGSRLSGPELKRKRGVGDMLSAGVIPGTVQVPPSGQPIILMGDSQTTGGYPRIAVVIRADLCKLAQAPLGGLLRLQPVDAAAALAAWDAQQRYLSSVATGLALLGWPGSTPGDPQDGN
ncbi:biotin-dependent carboxyltransferase family protein [Variovorax dokdonensis]|uniref:Biotin-dependent carboxyltransferase family protein n=1 Tax=Variovorax dokdonensis TaxID=344883 RepID=A0ABT7NBI0_9BURK|nr:biotin-dependent carboxyltransferase family protein [Variovorax dokdonensis]MDM0045300.1 biotin-dependent carboxyltransferase family protein [Variovorax dokdonensis]